MLMEKITAGLPPAIADALDDVGLEIDGIRSITKRMVGANRLSKSYEADQRQLNRLMSMVESRAGRIEPEPLTADGLLAYANAAARAGAAGRPGRKAETGRALTDQVQAALERESRAINALSAAQIERDAARRDREAAEQALDAHGTSVLVR